MKKKKTGTALRRSRNRHLQFDTLFLRRVPSALKAFFKAACAKRKQTMQEVLISYMRKVVKDDAEEMR